MKVAHKLFINQLTLFLHMHQQPLLIQSYAIKFQNKIITDNSSRILKKRVKVCWRGSGIQEMRQGWFYGCLGSDSFNSLRYNYFTQVAMAYRKLSQEEANKLCEQVLVLICKQNAAQKQKKMKNRNSTFPTFSEPALRSPPKTLMKQTKQQPLEYLTIQHQLEWEKSPLKKVLQTPQKLSLDKQSTFIELLDLSQQLQFKLIEKQESCLDLFHRASIMPSHKQLKIPAQLHNQAYQKHSLSEEVQEKIYTESLVKELKRDLEIQSRGKICKTQNLNSITGQIDGYHFLCKNDSDCPFNCYLEYAGKRTPTGEKIYRLISQNVAHLKACLEPEEEITFMKLTKVVDSLESSIAKLLSQNTQLKPKDVLTKIGQQLGESDHRFIYKGLNSKNYHKAAKKYFDNLIYKVKNPNWASS